MGACVTVVDRAVPNHQWLALTKMAATTCGTRPFQWRSCDRIYGFDGNMLSNISIIDRISVTFYTFNHFMLSLHEQNTVSVRSVLPTLERWHFFYRIWSNYDRRIVSGTSTWCITTRISLLFHVCQARTQTYDINSTYMTGEAGAVLPIRKTHLCTH